MSRPAGHRDPLRNQQIKAIHAMARELALHDDSYRAIVSRISQGRTESAAELTAGERAALLTHMRGLGAGRKGSAGRGGGGRAGDRPRAETAWARKARALWLSLYHLGELSDPSEEALAAFCHRQTQVDALQWLSPAEAWALIESLKQWCARCGFEVPATEEDGGAEAKRELCRAVWRRLGEFGVLRVPELVALDAWLHFRISSCKTSLTQLSADQLNAAAEKLGGWLRGEMQRRQVEAPLSAALREGASS